MAVGATHEVVEAGGNEIHFAAAMEIPTVKRSRVGEHLPLRMLAETETEPRWITECKSCSVWILCFISICCVNILKAK